MDILDLHVVDLKVLIVQVQVHVGVTMANIVLVIVVIGVGRFQFIQICVIRALVHVCVLIKTLYTDRKELSKV